jgi:nucleoside 2-deoxyribosyltransferase
MIAGVPLDEVEKWGLDVPLPFPQQLADSLILWIGENQPSRSEPLKVTADTLAGILGVGITPTKPNRDLHWLLSQPTLQKLAEQPNRSSPALELRLTWEGWIRHAELQETASTSKLAFMAMQFGDEELNSAFLSCFKPAVGKTGFDLRTLTDGQPAGCIDDQLRVALRTSQFVVADLTHGNKGAYWEAGYAEGLGRPVIYTCRRQEWDQQKTHFDTNHLVTVIWDLKNLDRAATELKAVIRATIPKEARLTDE